MSRGGAREGGRGREGLSANPTACSKRSGSLAAVACHAVCVARRRGTVSILQVDSEGKAPIQLLHVFARELPEGEREGLNARIEERDLERVFSGRRMLADELIQPLLRSRAVALGVNVKSVSSVGRLSIHQYAESYGSASSCRAHDEMLGRRVDLGRIL